MLDILHIIGVCIYATAILYVESWVMWHIIKWMTPLVLPQRTLPDYLTEEGAKNYIVEADGTHTLIKGRNDEHYTR